MVPGFTSMHRIVSRRVPRATTCAVFATITLLMALSSLKADDQAICEKREGTASIVGCTRLIVLGEAADPKLVSAHLSRGVLYRGLLDYDRAIADFTKAIELSKNLRRPDIVAAVLMVRGSTLALKDDLKSALSDFRAALVLDPSNVDAMNAVRRSDEALAARERLASLDQSLKDKSSSNLAHCDCDRQDTCERTSAEARNNFASCGPGAQTAKLDTQEGKILSAAEIADLTREIILSKLKAKKEGEPIIVWSAIIAELQKKIFGGQDFSAGVKGITDEKSYITTPLESEARRAYHDFTNRFEAYFDATTAAIRARMISEEFASAVENAKSKGVPTLDVPKSLVEFQEDNGLRNAEYIRSLALTLARANDKLLGTRRVAQ